MCVIVIEAQLQALLWSPVNRCSTVGFAVVDRLLGGEHLEIIFKFLGLHSHEGGDAKG
jgi:hypothetical protein